MDGVRSILLTLAAMVIGGFAATPLAHALDPPHNTNDQTPGYSVNCTACHYIASGPTPSWATAISPTNPDVTFFNNLCLDCHRAGRLSSSRFENVKTHSAQNTGSTYPPANWTIECRICHSPHYQQQATNINYNSEAGVNVRTDTVTSITSTPNAAQSSLTAAVGGFVPNEFADYLLVPNISHPERVYRIVANSNNAFTVAGAINPNYTAVGSTLGIRYGKLITYQIEPPGVGPWTVKFFNNAGPGSFATASAPVTSICMVCHTQTTSFRRDGTLEGPGHPPARAGTDCTECHTHSSGFRAECGSCHGNPPIVASLGGPSGLAINEGGTGTSNPGAHGKHAVSLGYACATCHTGGMPVSAIYDKRIQIGFNIAGGSYQTGSYDGRISLANGYTYTRGNLGTTITRSGTKVCANVYCHGSTMAPNAGTDPTPVWDNPSTGICGTCHGATASNPPIRGSHSLHARTDLLGYAYPCATCHRDPAVDASQHVNGGSEVALSGPSASGGVYSGTPAMLDAYGTCTNVYCHSTVQSSPPGGAPVYRVTPSWGGTIGSCGACHDYSPAIATGSHGKHMQFYEMQQCYPCHNYNASNDECLACHDPGSIEPQRDRHADRRIDVAFAPMYGGSYSGTPAPGDAYGSCSSNYCHSTVQGNPDPLLLPSYATPSWGQTFSGVCGRGACHAVGHAHPTDSGYAPLTSGSHAVHLRYRFDQDGNCQSCHYDPSYGGCGTCHNRTVSHADRSIDVVFHPLFPTAAGGASGTYSGDMVPRTAYGSCSALYCHSQGTNGSPPYSAPNVTAVVWGGTGMPADCTGCHDGDRTSTAPMHTGSHGRHVRSHAIDCVRCHSQTVSTSRTLNTTTYNGNLTLGHRNHSNGWINVAYSAASDSQGTYAGQTTPITFRVPGSAYGACGNTYCHSTGTSLSTGVLAALATPTWGTAGPLPCNACHGSEAGNDGTGRPWYDNGSPKANSHRRASHVDSPCSDCHFGTTMNGTTIADTSLHANSSYDVVPNTSVGISFTYDFSTGGGLCSSVSCHAGNSPGVWGQ